MSLRRFMHPRNKYKEEPNFKQLAILYPEFRQVAITDLSGKVRLNFKDLESLRVLGKTLLKHDFDLEVEIPPTKLVPAVPLRMNYILWIEDLLNHAKITDMSSVHGLDIGTGAVCVYPLLFSKLYGCKMTGTEIDSDSIKSAVRNIESNNLQHLIEVLPVKEGTILEGAGLEDKSYSFTMCNPPFFCTEEDLGCKSKSLGSRPPPRNAPTGSSVELFVQGGEKDFVLKMIDDSTKMGARAKIYTTMLGRKSSLLFLLPEMQMRKIDNMTWTEFCQGHTTRWGLAWTFLSKDEVDLKTAPVIRKKGDEVKIKQLKDRPPVEIVVPKKGNILHTADLVTTLKQWMKELDIQVEELDLDESESDCWACQLEASQDTWTHARRKRRITLQQESPDKKPRLEDAASADDNNPEEVADKVDVTSSTRQCPVTDGNIEVTDKVDATAFKEPLLVCGLIVGEVENEDEASSDKLKLSMTFENGHGGRNALETFRQYLINRLDVREFLQKQTLTKKQKKQQKRDKKNKRF